MNVSGQDINQTLEYRSATAIVRLLPTGLLLVFLGLLIFALVDLDREPWTLIGIVLCWVVGGALVGLTLWRRWNPGKPLFTLSPAGIHYRIPMVKEILIPWQEIQGVDTIDVEAGYWSIRSTQFLDPEIQYVGRPRRHRHPAAEAVLRSADLCRFTVSARPRLEGQLHSQRRAGPGGVASRTRFGRPAGAPRSG